MKQPGHRSNGKHNLIIINQVGYSHRSSCTYYKLRPSAPYSRCNLMLLQRREATAAVKATEREQFLKHA